MPDLQPEGIPDALMVNQPFGELTAPPRPSPTEWLGQKLQDALEAAGAAPHVARHLVEGLGGIAGATPLGIAGSAADAIDAKARGNAAGTVQAMAGMLPGIGPEARAVAREAAPVIRAYHGSPHDFDRFSLEKIGTGEGAQVYGHGMYFAENPAVAKSYRDALAEDVKIGGQKYDMYNPLHVATVQVEESGSRAKAIKEIQEAVDRDPGDPSGHYQKVLNILKSDKELPEFKSSGRMYEVNINADPNHFLDWDKPLSEQSPAVMEMAAKAYGLPQDKFHDLLFARPKTPEDTAKLKEAGIPGIKYLDQGSRSVGEGSRNYVVFDDNLINIVKKYGLAGISMLPPATAAFLSQRITPVDHNPFALGGNPAVTPVDHDPFNPENNT
jgi:hypothetical protein